MMQAIRTRAGSIIVKVLFGLLIVSFGFWGIYTRSPYFQSHSPDTVIATVGDQDIRAEQLQKLLQPTIERMRAQLGANFSEQQVKELGILDRLLGQLVNSALLDQEAGRLNLELSDDVIRNAIYANPVFQGPNGRFDRRTFEQVLMMNRLTEDQLVKELRRDIPRADLVQALTTGVAAPKSIVDALYRYRDEKRVADIVEFPAAAVKDVGKPDAAALKKFYDAHADLFRAPEYRSFTLAALSPADLTDKAPIPEARLRKAYEQRKDEYATPERRDIQQILAPSEAKAKAAEAALKAGKDWKEVATTIAGMAPDAIDLGLLTRDEIPHALGDVAFSLQLNAVSKPIKTPLGWHILRVVKIEPATTKSFAEVKAKLEKELKQRDAVNRLVKIGNEADDALAGGAKLTEVAAKYGLKLTTIAAADEDGKDRAGKPIKLPFAADAIMKTAFQTNAGETSRVIDAPDGAIYAVHVEKITPPATRPLAEVKDKAIADWQAEQRRDRAKKEEKALAALVAPDKPLAKVAGKKGVTLLSAVTLGRVPKPGAQFPPALIAKLFSAKPGAVVSASDATGAYTAQLKEIRVPKTVPAADADKISKELVNELKLDIASEFTDALRKRFPVEIKRDALNRMF